MFGEYVLGRDKLAAAIESGLEITVSDTPSFTEMIEDGVILETGTDSPSFSETFGGTLDQIESVSDSPTITETIVASNPNIPESASDAPSISESYVSSNPNIPESASDAPSISETYAASNPNIQKVIQDLDVPLSETYASNNPNVLMDVDENVSFSEALVSNDANIHIILFQNFTVSEQISSNDLNIAISLQDPLLFFETRLVAGEQQYTISQSVSFTETFGANTPNIQESVTDAGLSFSETYVGSDPNIQISISDTPSVTDAIIASDPNIQLSVSDTPGGSIGLGNYFEVTDTVISNDPNIQIPISDLLTVTEVWEETLPWYVAVEDVLQVNETYAREGMDTLEGVSDVLSYFEYFLPGPTETVTDTPTFEEDFGESEPDDSLTPSESIDIDVSVGVKDVVTFTEEVIAGHQQSDSDTENVVVNEYIIAYVESVLNVCIYTPFGPAAVYPEPDHTLQDSVTLEYPTSSPTTTLTLRPPEFSNSRRYEQNRISRRTMKGKRIVYRPSGWPTKTVLSLQFVLVSHTNRGIFEGLYFDSLGKDVRYTDHEGRAWVGTILPEPQIVENRRGCGYEYDLSFQFQGELE